MEHPYNEILSTALKRIRELSMYWHVKDLKTYLKIKKQNNKELAYLYNFFKEKRISINICVYLERHLLKCPIRNMIRVTFWEIDWEKLW